MAQRGGVTDATGQNPKLKLLVDRPSRRIVFAEASKDAIDFLLSLLLLPLGSVTRLLSPDGMVRSLGKLYASMQSIDDAYLIHPKIDRNALLNPELPSPSAFPRATTTLLLQNAPTRTTKEYYRCSQESYRSYYGTYYGCPGQYQHVTDVSGTACPSCGSTMNVAMKFVAGAADAAAEKARADAGGGYVRSMVTYVVMDDLAVTPMSTFSAVAPLNKLHVTDVSSLYEWTVELGMEEGLELLKASLESETVLTDVFCKKSKMGMLRPFV